MLKPQKIEAKINIALIDPNAKYPKYAHEDDAGADLYSCENTTLPPHDRKLIATGVTMEIPQGFEGQIRPRSGNALQYGFTVLNTPGTIDSNYRGEICVLLYNTTDEPIDIYIGDRIAQIVFCKLPFISLVHADELSDSDRGSNGFGSTGR